ncbi:hypothetical protein AC579_7034 [Pseudocercospora musae]|uniref:Trimethylguanosine synthase n=1 Tax=Pseudocercospora musae TaxID=113226 RepID=A0A139IA79_9PEZI|nr:hypothetical protein AC579_7034 [Pseudocercospora musae]
MTSAVEAPEGVQHYHFLAEVPSNIAKYWQQRHQIFSKYDEGVWLTDDAWFGVTPEPMANRIAEHVAKAPASKTILIDAFAGAGGNTIAFALSGRWKQIFAVEKDPRTLACAKHNAEVYGVAKKIFWIQGDIFEALKVRLKAAAKNAVIFGSPPWGGPSYNEHEVFDLTQMEPYNIDLLYDSFNKLTNEVVLYLPRTSDVRQLAKHAKKDQKLPIKHYCMRGASKALCVFYGSFELNQEAEG